MVAAVGVGTKVIRQEETRLTVKDFFAGHKTASQGVCLAKKRVQFNSNCVWIKLAL